MRKITLMIIVSLMSFLGYAQGLPLEIFDSPWTVNGASLENAPPGWIVNNRYGINKQWIQTIPGNASMVPYGGTGHSAYLDREQAGGAGTIPEDWLITKEFIVPANGELTFVSRLTIQQDQGSIYRIKIIEIGGTSGNPTGVAPPLDNYVTLQTLTELQMNPSQQDWANKSFLIPAAYANKTVRIAFVMEGDFKDRWFIDNVMVAAACVAPVTLTVNNVTLGTTTAELSWTSPGVSKWDVDIVLDSQAPTGVGVEYSGTLPYLKTGLLECTSYKYFVRAKCDGGGISPWQGPFFFKTRCLGENCASPIVIPPALPYSTSNTTAAFTDFYEGTPGTGCVGTGNYLAGNDVVYSFKPAVTGPLNITLSNTGGPAGMFIYSSCANIGVSCITGVLASASTNGEIPAFPGVADTTYYIVISTNGTPQTTNYTLTIQQAACAKPTAGTAVAAATSADLSWTPGTAGATQWEVAVQPVNSGIPAGSGQPTSVNTNSPVTTTNAGAPLTVATSYEYYVREKCATPANTYSIWAGPFLFSTTQVPSPLDYVENFDGATHGWALSNGNQINKWYVGTATSNSPGKSLYISNDNSITNAYTTTSASIVHAYKDVMLPAIVSDLSLTFDWKCLGEGTVDYLRVWLVPASFTPTAGAGITAATDRIQVGGNLNNSGTFWNSSTNVINVTGMGGTARRLVFEWRNNANSGSQPPAAVDNVNLKVITCPQPTALVLGTFNDTAIQVNWTAPAPAPAGYDVYYSTTSNTPPTSATVPQVENIPTPTYTFNNPTPSATYYVWVRSNCGSTDKSFWTGPISFNTPQVPATMNYTQNFDLGAHNFTLSNGTQTNKWAVGTATFNSPGSSLYISEDNGATSTYNVNATTAVHAYRDIQMPATVNQLLLKFDWKCMGEGTTNPLDYIRVWIVPVTFSPTPGAGITAAADRIAVTGMLNQSADWKTSTNVLTVPTFGGQVKRLVFEWRNDLSVGVMPAGAVDNINLSVITCQAPSALVLNSTTLGSATFSWTAPTQVPASYDYYISTGTTPPADSEVGVNVPTGTTATAGSLAESTSYNVWVRSHCGGTDGNSFWIGPLNFLTPQTPATMDYTQNFDAGAHGWALNNGNQVNKWVVGAATSNSPANSLYISNDNGVTNAYTIGTTAVVHAYRDIQLPAVSEQLLLSFDWKNAGQANTDYVRVWMVPLTYNLVPGTQITAAADRVQVGGNFSDSATWKNFQSVIFANAYASQVRRLVFEWRNDNFSGTQPPAAIDNINLTYIQCPQPSALVLTNTTTATAAFSWTAPITTAPTYDVYYSTDPTAPTATTVPNGGTAVVPTNASISGLEDGVNYNVWVRSNCGPNGTSLWIGPLNFNTMQIPADLNYVQNFDGVAPHKWMLNNGTQTNKWTVGTATFNSPGKSLYISNDNGVTNNYDTGAQSTVHAYRDIMIPATANLVDISFDWKNIGEGTLPGTVWDYIKVWVVPVTFNPTPGTLITAAADRIQLGPVLNQSPTWKNALYVYNAAAVAGQPVRVVFEWRNDTSGGTPPPAAIDNIDIRLLTCPQPTALQVLERTMTTAKLAWTETGTAPSWEVYVVPAGQPAPTATTDGEDAATNPYVYSTGLQAGTSYQYYVRSICSTTDKSRWSGPFAFNTTICDPVDQCAYDFILTDSGNNGWQGNTMLVRQNGILVATLGPQITNGGPTTVSVPLCSGIPFEVFWVNGKNSTPAAAYDSHKEVGLQIKNPFNGQTVFNRVAGSPALNMGTVIYTGMAYCQTITCVQPTALVSESVPNAPNTTKLRWTPGGAETKWEVVFQPQGGNFPSAAPTGTISVENNPNVVIPGLVSGQLYEYYVRAICDVNSKSFWSGPLYFSIFTPPACADVTVLDPDLVIIAPDTEYVICSGDELNVDFKASYFQASQTTSYGITSIPYALPFPATGGTKMDITTDDQWAPVAQLPFEFCFFGQTYNRAQVGSNGVISFDANFETGANCAYDFNNAQIPSTTFPIKNAIYGVYQDIDVKKIAASFAHPEINYQVIGNYPCRAFVVNFSEIAQYGSGCAIDPAIGAQTSQVVIYEITNIIEVYVKNRKACLDWQEGDGVIGIQNAAGTVAYAPPGRNTGPWNAELEAWRFTPNGAVSTSTFEWLKNGEHYSNNTDITVTATEAGTTTMTARATYSLCNGEEMLRESNFVIKVQEEIITAPLKNLIGCGNGEDVTFNLNNALVDIVTPEDYTFTFYATEAAAQAGGADNLPTPTAYVTNQTVTVWVRILKNGSPCFVVKSFTITIANNPPQFTLPADFSLCAGTSGTISVVPDAPTLPGGFDLADATYTWTRNGDPLPDTTPTITVTIAGIYAVTVNKSGCINTKSTEVIITPMPVVTAQEDVTRCDSFTLPALTTGNYFEQTGGVGPLSAGDVISSTKTIFVYAESGTTPNCTAEDSFVVTIVPSPVVTDIADVVECDTYTLPVLTVGNYFTETGGAGTMLNAGDVFNTVGVTTVFIYAANGTAPNICSDEESFTVTITGTPVVDTPANVVQCASYELPALTSGSYFTGPNGTGTPLAAGTSITSTQTVYVFKQTGDCTAQSSFTVTIIPSAVITTEKGCEGSAYNIKVIFDKDGAYHPDNVTIEWTNSSDVKVGSEPTLTVTEPGIYTVTVTPIGGVECPVSSDVIVDSTTCDIPRGISPNGDGMNDEFDLSTLKVKKLAIFNRYGQEVYSKSNYKKEWIGQGGNGDQLPTGTYFYMIEREGGESVTGWVYINRQE